MNAGHKQKVPRKWPTIIACLSMAVLLGVFASMHSLPASILFYEVHINDFDASDHIMSAVLIRSVIGGVCYSLAAGFVIYLAYWLKRNSD